MQKENEHVSDCFAMIRLAYENTAFLIQDNQAHCSFHHRNLSSFSWIEWLQKRKITINSQFDIL